MKTLILLCSHFRIARLFESGILIKWKKDGLPPDNECNTKAKPQAGDTRKINLSQMIGSFYILMFGLSGALFALLVEYLYLTIKNKGQIPQIRGLQCKILSYCCPSMFSSGKADYDKKFMHTRMYPGLKEPIKPRKKKKGRKNKIKALQGKDNKGIKKHFLIFKLRCTEILYTQISALFNPRIFEKSSHNNIGEKII